MFVGASRVVAAILMTIEQIGFFKSMVIVLVGLCVWEFWLGPGPDYTVKDAQATEADQAVVDKAFAALRGHCKGIERNWSQFETKDASYYRENGDYRFERYGWSETVRFSLKLRDDARLQNPRANGQTLHFVVGGGTHPGVTASKTWTKELCGLRTDRDQDEFASIPAMARAFEAPPPK